MLALLDNSLILVSTTSMILLISSSLMAAESRLSLEGVRLRRRGGLLVRRSSGSNKMSEGADSGARHHGGLFCYILVQ